MTIFRATTAITPRKSVLAGAAAALLAGSPLAAHATAITPGETFTVTFDDAVSGHPDLTATAVFSNFHFVSTSQITFDLDITNTTQNTGTGAYTNDRLVSFGWDSAPVASSGTSSPNVFANVSQDSIPSLSLVNLCLYSGNNCSGGGNTGLESQDLATAQNPYTTGTFLVTLNYNGQTVPPLDFSNFGVKFQTNVTSYEFYDSTTTPDPVPEPASLALLGTGLFGLGLLRLRRRNVCDIV